MTTYDKLAALRKRLALPSTTVGDAVMTLLLRYDSTAIHRTDGGWRVSICDSRVDGQALALTIIEAAYGAEVWND